MDYQLRKPKDEEYDLLFDLKKRAFSECVITTWGKWEDTIQHDFFRQDFSDPDLEIITLSDKAVGMLNVKREESQIWINAFYVDPDFQGRGLGTKILQDLIKEALGKGLPIKLQVLYCNVRAKQLYEKVGFKCLGDGPDEHYYLMEYRQGLT